MNHRNADLVPLSSLCLNPRRGELLSAAVYDLVHTKVVLKRIETADVVIVLIVAPPDGTASLVLITGDGLDPDAQLEVFEGSVVSNREIERAAVVFCPHEGQYIRFARSR